MKLTATQIAAKIGVTSYTVKRWYEFYDDLTEEEKNELHVEHGMPLLPNYDEVGNRRDKIWDEVDVATLEEFKNWVPPTKNGIFKKYKKEEA